MAFSLESERPSAVALSVSPLRAFLTWIGERRAKHAQRVALSSLLDLDAEMPKTLASIARTSSRRCAALPMRAPPFTPGAPGRPTIGSLTPEAPPGPQAALPASDSAQAPSCQCQGRPPPAGPLS